MMEITILGTGAVHLVQLKTVIFAGPDLTHSTSAVKQSAGTDESRAQLKSVMTLTSSTGTAATSFAK